MDYPNNGIGHRFPERASLLVPLLVAGLGLVAGGCNVEEPEEELGTASSAVTTGLCGYYPYPGGYAGPSAPPCIGACYSDGDGGHCADPGDSQQFLVAYGCPGKTGGQPCDGNTNGGVQLGVWNGGETVSVASLSGDMQWCTFQLDIISISNNQVTLYDYLIWERAECGAPPSNTPPVCVPGHPEVCAPAGQCTANASIDAGSHDPDGDPVTVSQSPPGPYGLGTTPVTLTVSDGTDTSTCQGSVTVDDCEPPVITCHDTVAECTGNGSALVDPIDATAVDTCSAVTVNEYGEGTYPLGTTMLDYTATDAHGNSASCQGTVSVADTQAPVVTIAGVPPLRPPNHDHVEIDIAQCLESVTDVCEGDLSSSAEITCVTSDEPENAQGGGDGNTLGDIIIVDGRHVLLRAERMGNGNGRVYRITLQVKDSSGNVTTASCPVDVPHDNADDSAVEDTPVYEVCLP
jgi:hypothetical protein